eukprot:g20803.t1
MRRIVSSEEARMGTAAVTTPVEAALTGPDPIDTGIAVFLVVSCLGALMVSSVAMVLFFRERNSFEIKARSSYLSLLNGGCFMTVMMVVVATRLPDIFSDLRSNIYVIFPLYFFALVCSTASYGSRTIRLALLYSPKARKAAPWLLPERIHVIVCLLLGAASTAVPLYDMAQVGDGPPAELEYALLAWDHLWIVIFTSQAIVLLLNPIAWLVDDIFGIGPELRVMMLLQMVSVVTGRIAEEYAHSGLLRWVGTGISGFVVAITMVSITIISPIMRRLLRPMESSDPKVIKALQRRKAFAATTGILVGPPRLGRTSSADEDGDIIFSSSTVAATEQPSSVTTSSPGSWTFERVMESPEISAAFEAFSQKALCQESFLFLVDASKFQAHRDGQVGADVVHDTEHDTEHGSSKAGETYEDRHEGKSEDNQEQFSLFLKIVREYIVDGAPNEINISWNDKSDILDIYNNKRPGAPGFCDLPASDRR